MDFKPTSFFKYIIAIVSGIFLFLSFPKFGNKSFSWFALTPLLYIVIANSLSNQRIEKNDIYEVVILSLITGLISWVGILYWIVPTFVVAKEHIIFGILALILLSLYCSLYLIGFNLITYVYLKKLKKITILTIFSIASLWVLTEYFRGWIFSGFPWMFLGYSQYDNLPLIQIAEYFGVYGVSFVVFFVNFAIAWYFYKLLIKKETVKFTTLFLFLISIATILILGIKKIITINKQINFTKPTLTVVLLQGNIDQYKKWDKEYINEIMVTYSKLVQQGVLFIKEGNFKTSPYLFVWPESATPGWLFEDKNLYSWVANLIDFSNKQIGSEVYHLIGTIRAEKNNPLIYYNSVALFSDNDKNNMPTLEKIYDKIHLVPFGEYVPFRKILGKFIKTVNELGEFSPGKEFSVFNIPKTKINFSTLICYESIFPELTSRFINSGAEILINITNDAWFLKTSAPYQHFVANIFRAVENRCYVIRCANTGISAVISPTGKILQKTELFKTTTTISEIRKFHYKTFYSKFAKMLWVLYLFLFLLPFKLNS